MKKLVLLSLISFLALSLAVHAQSDTAHHRAVYDEINAKENSLKQITSTHKIESKFYDLTGWLENGEVRKISALTGANGRDATEYYLEDGKLLFVYHTYLTRSADGGKGRGVFERLYFKDGSIFKWLTTEKPAPVFHGEDYQATTELYTTNCEAFVAALKKGKGAAGKPKAAAKLTDGTFLGIEEGDYFHWKMRTADGDEVSYFILKPDASVDKVIENPEAHIGKKCRVTWKASTENLPEAGGKAEIEQILSVEWLAKKK